MNFFFPVGLLLLSMPSASAGDFLAMNTSEPEADTDMSDMVAVLLTGSHSDTVDLMRDQLGKESHARNEAALESMFKALPKNDKGNLPLPAARYALHRLFEHRHRWFVRGLHPDMASNHSLGQALQTMTALDQKGLTLPGLAALAGTLEQLIHKEMASHLKDFFQSQGHSVEDAISGETLAQIVDSYMTVYISGADFRQFSPKDVQKDNDFMAKNTKDWTETKEWVKSAFQDAAKTEGCVDEPRACQFRFADSARVVGAIVQKFGYFNDRQCHQVKSKLVGMAEHRSGRVKLAEFYKAGLSNSWMFNEKIDYLRSLGALDETVKDSPKVLVPNYVSSWPNCLAPSQFYAVCCRNECEDYMQVIEKRIDGAMADPDDIMRLVETHSAFTEDAPPNLAALRPRLVSIAERHHGKVPIHGRLFAQWMHHAFPSQCAYPHEAGTTNPQTSNEWMSQTGQTDTAASQDEVATIVSQHEEKNGPAQEVAGEPSEELASKSSEDEPTAASSDPSELPWTDVEELLVVRPLLKPQSTATTFLGNLIDFVNPWKSKPHSKASLMGSVRKARQAAKAAAQGLPAKGSKSANLRKA